MELYLIRHPRPAIDPAVCHGRLDVPPAPDFEAAADRLTSMLAPGAGIVTAPTQRCLRFARFVAGLFGTTLESDERLQELDFGDWEGRRWDEIPRVEASAWSRNFWDQPAPGGESYSQLHARVQAVWESMIAREDEALALIAPIGPLRALLTIGLQLPPEAFLRFHVDFGGIAKLSDASGDWRLDYANR